MTTMTQNQMPRHKARYREEIVPALQEQFSFENIMQVPRVTKVVVNEEAVMSDAGPLMIHAEGKEEASAG